MVLQVSECFDMGLEERSLECSFSTTVATMASSSSFRSRLLFSMRNAEECEPFYSLSLSPSKLHPQTGPPRAIVPAEVQLTTVIMDTTHSPLLAHG